MKIGSLDIFCPQCQRAAVHLKHAYLQKLDRENNVFGHQMMIAAGWSALCMSSREEYLSVWAFFMWMNLCGTYFASVLWLN